MPRLDLLDMIDWYRRCLEDVVDRRPVKGLAEAKAGYDTAMFHLRLEAERDNEIQALPPPSSSA